MEALAQLFPLALIALLFWALLIRPASRQRKQAAQMQASLAVGDRVMLTSGVFGTVHGFDEEQARLLVEVAPGAVLQVARAAVASVERDDEPVADEQPPADGPGTHQEL